MQPPVGHGTSALAGHAHAATQNDTEKQQDAGAAQMSSDQDKEGHNYSSYFNFAEGQERNIARQLSSKLHHYEVHKILVAGDLYDLNNLPEK